jgi:hypothetical protein
MIIEQLELPFGHLDEISISILSFWRPVKRNEGIMRNMAACMILKALCKVSPSVSLIYSDIRIHVLYSLVHGITHSIMSPLLTQYSVLDWTSTDSPLHEGNKINL